MHSRIYAFTITCAFPPKIIVVEVDKAQEIRENSRIGRHNFREAPSQNNEGESYQ